MPIEWSKKNDKRKERGWSHREWIEVKQSIGRGARTIVRNRKRSRRRKWSGPKWRIVNSVRFGSWVSEGQSERTKRTKTRRERTRKKRKWTMSHGFLRHRRVELLCKKRAGTSKNAKTGGPFEIVMNLLHVVTNNEIEVDSIEPCSFQLSICSDADFVGLNLK